MAPTLSSSPGSKNFWVRPNSPPGKVQGEGGIVKGNGAVDIGDRFLESADGGGLSPFVGLDELVSQIELVAVFGEVLGCGIPADNRPLAAINAFGEEHLQLGGTDAVLSGLEDAGLVIDAENIAVLLVARVWSRWATARAAALNLVVALKKKCPRALSALNPSLENGTASTTSPPRRRILGGFDPPPTVQATFFAGAVGNRASVVSALTVQSLAD